VQVSDNLVGLVDGQLSRIMELALHHLDMDFVFAAEFVGDRLICRALGGDGDSFGITIGDGVPLATAYSPRMVRGEVPNAVPDARAEGLLSGTAGTANVGIGAYIGVPLFWSEKTVFGSFCCLSRHAHELGERDVRFMQMLADVVVVELKTRQAHARESERIAELVRSAAVEIALQPIFDVHDGRCLGMEALARFPAAYGSVEDVFDSATSVGLGLPLERLALISAVAKLPLLLPEQYLSVNLTPQVALQLAETAEQRPELLRRLVLEITEREAIGSYADIRRALQPSRDLGLRLAIDDAGAGYASLKHVVELEPDFIKIDRSLVHGASSDRARRSVISAFVLLAVDLNASVVAEGVEEPSDFETIKDLGIDAAQGYLLARPTTDRTAVAKWRNPNRTFPRGPAAGSSLIAKPR
jgi:EAL domain-containing protein (putative c-di-GMP-specific phosphodiesterase class I)